MKKNGLFYPRWQDIDKQSRQIVGDRDKIRHILANLTMF